MVEPVVADNSGQAPPLSLRPQPYQPSIDVAAHLRPPRLDSALAINRMAKFKVDETLTLKSKNQFYVCGEIIEGTIKRGDRLLLPWNSEFGMEGLITSIEFMDRISKKESKVALGIKCESEEEKELWELMKLGSEEILEIKENNLSQQGASHNAGKPAS